MTIRTLVNAAVVLALAIGFGACGGSNSPSSPDPGNNGTIAATIVIDSTGNVTPRDVTVAAGSRVTSRITTTPAIRWRRIHIRSIRSVRR